MKISPQEFPRFSKSPKQSLVSILFYGEEEALTDSKIELFLSLAPFAKRATLHQVFEEDILQSKIILRDILATPDLFSGPSLVFIKNASDKLVPFIKEILENKSPTCPCIIKSTSYLRPSSKLRKLFEEHEDLAAIACYALSIKEIETQIQGILISHQKKISSSLLENLAYLFQDHMFMLKQELEKLILYLGTRDAIEEKDVRLALSGIISSSADNLTSSFLDRNPGVFSKHFRSQLAEEGTPIGILRNLNMYLVRLHEAHTLLGSGKSLDLIMRSLKPAVFFTEKSQFQRHLNLWSSPMLQKTITNLLLLEVECKLNSSLSEELCSQFLLKEII